MKKKKEILLQCFFFLCFFYHTSSVKAASLAILPVLSERIESRLIKRGPKLFRSQQKNNWELARLIRTLLSVGEFHSLTTIDTIQRAYKKFGLNSRQHLQIDQLSGLGKESDSERMLVSLLQREGNVYILTTRIFYTSSQSLADTLQTTSTDLWELIDTHLRERFPSYKRQALFSSNKKQTILFLLDTSGSNYKEIGALKNLILRHEKFRTGICTLSGIGTVSFLRVGLSKKALVRFLSQIHPHGGTKQLKNTFRALNCLKNILPKREKRKQVKIIILVSSAPEGEQEKRRTKLILRRLAGEVKILIVGSSDLRPSHRDFWRETVEEFSRSHHQHLYKDLMYRQKLGLVNGDEVYIIKKGNQLLQSMSKNILANPDFVMDVPPKYWPSLNPGNIQYLYTKLSGNRVINADTIEILMKETIFDYLESSIIKKYERRQDYVKLLIEMESAKFWLSLPKKIIYTNQGLMKIKKGGSYYFMLNMEPGSQGIPFKNKPNFGMIYESFSNLPRILLLGLHDYLKDSSQYLGHSIGGSSLYIFFAKIRAIKLNGRQ